MTDNDRKAGVPPVMSDLHIPELIYRTPDCPLCYRETSHDGDSLYCQDCDVYWPDSRGNGRRLDEDLDPCESTCQPYADSLLPDLRGHTYRCLLTAGHNGEHAGVRVDKPRHWDEGTERWP